MESRFPRLTAEDLINLAAEGPDTPIHVAAIAVLDGTTLGDPAGRPRLAEIRAAVEARLARVPRLRQVIRPSGPFGGRPVWVDAPRFRIADHVGVAELPPPYDEGALLRLAERLLVPVLDRSRPLWRMWLIPGLPDGRMAVMFLLHHVVADGMAAIRMVTTLLGDTPPHPDPTIGPGPTPLPETPPHPGPTIGPGPTPLPESTPHPDPSWRPRPAPRWRALVADRLRDLRPAPPVRRTGSPLPGLRMLGAAWRSPRTSLNVPLTPGRRLVVLPFPLAEARTVAHRYGATVNDLILALAAGGVRALLRSRGEPADRLWLNCTVAVSLRAGSAGPDGNRTGAMLVRLPVAAGQPADRLRAVTAATARAKGEQSVTAANGILVALARLGLVRWFSRRQHVTALVESNMTGPVTPIRLLGAPVRRVIAVGNLAGNVALSVVALSYAGELTVTVQAGADGFPDLPTLVAGIRQDWATLAAGCHPSGAGGVPAGGGPRAGAAAGDLRAGRNRRPMT
ncbi:wax ester/triacylglycerol synthase domain-containing protein [Actinoplanes teichomyceticus]|nr:wax ester/triacylglycerol synthase domain-containing protein [Actinoplanes teichomyceticus]